MILPCSHKVFELIFFFFWWKYNMIFLLPGSDCFWFWLTTRVCLLTLPLPVTACVPHDTYSLPSITPLERHDRMFAYQYFLHLSNHLFQNILTSLLFICKCVFVLYTHAPASFPLYLHIYVEHFTNPHVNTNSCFIFEKLCNCVFRIPWL